MSVRFNDRPFRASHGRSPSGRGTWAFGFGEDPADVALAWFAPSGLTYTQAKAAAKAEAARRGFDGTLFTLS